MLTLTWDIDILFEKLKPGTTGWICVWEIPLSANMLLWVGISLKVCSLAAKEQTKARGNCVCCLVTVVILFVGPGSRVKEVEDSMLSYGGKGKSYKQEELLWSTIKNYRGSWPLNYSIWNYLPLSVYCRVKRYMYYIWFLLTKTS